MPFKSKAQVRKFFAMANRGEMPMSKVREWIRKTKNIARLPEKKAEAMSAQPVDKQINRINQYLQSKGVVAGGVPTLREQRPMRMIEQGTPDAKQKIYK